MSNLPVQAGLATIVLTALQVALSFLAPQATREGGGGGFGLLLASNALIATVLAGIARGLRLPRTKRALVLWAIWGGVQANSLLELLLFDIGIPRADIARLFLTLLSVSAAFSAFLGLVLRPGAPTAAAASPAAAGRPVWWRWALCIVLYEAFYFTAGTFAWPYLQAFYSARPMPSVPSILAFQVLRGLVFALVVLAAIRALRVTGARAALAGGVILGVLGGVAPLIAPNVYLPDGVRLAHLIEVGISNLLFGALAGWLLAARGGHARPAASSFVAAAS